MKIKNKQRKQLIEALTIIIMFLAIISAYLGLRFFLNTDLPLVVVASGSMRPALQVGDLVIVQGVNATQIKEKDIVVFDLTEDNQTTPTVHRIIGIRALSNGTRLFTTKGDNNTSPDLTPVSENQIHGRVIYRIPLIGYLSLDPTIPLAIVIITLIAILIWPEKHRKKRHLHRSKSRPKTNANPNNNRPKHHIPTHIRLQIEGLSTVARTHKNKH